MNERDKKIQEIKERIISQKKIDYLLMNEKEIMKDKISFLEKLVYDLVNAFILGTIIFSSS